MTTTSSTTTQTPADDDAPPPVSRPQPLSHADAVARPPRTRRGADAAADRMLERLAASDYAGALAAAEALLVREPEHDDARECAEIARSELRRSYVSRLGSLDRVPRLAMSVHGLLALSLDFRAGFVLSRVDGQSSLRAISQAPGLPPLEALRLLSELYLQCVIAFDDERDG